MFLIIAYQIEPETYRKLGIKGHPAIPGIFKNVHLLRNADKPITMAFHFLGLVFTIFSFAGIILLVIQVLRLIFYAA